MHTHIRPHHQRAIDRLTDTYQQNPEFVALIIGGSVAKGCAREDSDVDFLIVARDQDFQQRKNKSDLFINRTDLCDYPGGFVDGKIINLNYLQQLAAKGNEPSRAAFDGAFLAFSQLPELEALLEKIPVYQEEGHDQRIKSFYSMAFIQHWLMNEASRHDNLYTKARAASQMALYASRLILAHNRVLFPYHKWLMHYLEKCPKKPVGLKTQIDALLKNPNMENCDTLFQNLREFHDWGIPDLEAFSWFMEEVEWSWMADKTPLEDL